MAPYHEVVRAKLGVATTGNAVAVLMVDDRFRARYLEHRETCSPESGQAV